METKKKPSLYEVSELFGNTVKEQYFSPRQDDCSFFMCVIDGNDDGCVALGSGNDIIESLIKAYKKDKRIAELVSVSLVDYARRTTCKL